MLGTGPLLGQALQFRFSICIFHEFCSHFSAQACLINSYRFIRVAKLSMATDRKRANRALKRLIEKGMLSVEDAHFQHGQAASASSKAAGAAAPEPPYPPPAAVFLAASSKSAPPEPPYPPPKQQKTAASAASGSAGPAASGDDESWGDWVAQNAAVGDPKSWQFKGEGKGGSLGTFVGSHSTDTVVAGARTNAKPPPAPKANTKESVQELFDTGYYKYPEAPFWDGKDLKDVARGAHCLWKNVPRGKAGGDSTKTEVFHGECHGWERDDVILS